MLCDDLDHAFVIVTKRRFDRRIEAQYTNKFIQYTMGVHMELLSRCVDDLAASPRSSAGSEFKAVCRFTATQPLMR